MKKDSILKALGITFAIVILLSWVIPAGTYSNGTYTALGSTSPIGLYDFIRVPVLTFATFIQFGILFLAIGGFYGVLNQTGAYSNIVSSVAKKWSANKKTFLIITVIMFALLTSLTGLTDLMFLLVPFFVTILLKLGYNKLTTFTSTVGSILVGNIGSTLGFNMWGYLAYYLSLDMTTLIFARIVLLIMMVALLFIILLKDTALKSKKVKKENDELIIPLYEEGTTKKSSLPLVVLLIITFILFLIGGYNWYYSFEIEYFSELYSNIASIEFGGRTWISDILSLQNTPALGFFENYDMTIILIFASVVIGWIYNVKIKDIVSSFVKGAKEMLLPATYAMLSCVIFASMLNLSEGNFVNTIVSKFVNAEEFSFLGTVGTGLVTSFVYNDFTSLLGNFSSIFTAYDANVIPVVAFIIQGMFGIISLIAPTSMYLVVGLSFLDVSYKEWIKHIWKYALILFGIIIIVAFILVTII